MTFSDGRIPSLKLRIPSLNAFATHFRSLNFVAEMLVAKIFWRRIRRHFGEEVVANFGSSQRPLSEEFVAKIATEFVAILARESLLFLPIFPDESVAKLATNSSQKIGLICGRFWHFWRRFCHT